MGFTFTGCTRSAVVAYTSHTTEYVLLLCMYVVGAHITVIDDTRSTGAIAVVGVSPEMQGALSTAL